MCCTMTTPGIVGGSIFTIRRMASVPPVEAPMAMTLSVELASARSSCPETGRCAGSCFFCCASRFQASRLAAAAIFTLARSSFIMAPRPLAISDFGLFTKSIAPASKASMVICPPRSVRALTMITGSGYCAIRRRKKATPSIRGISTSSVSTSGCSCRILSRAI